MTGRSGAVGRPRAQVEGGGALTLPAAPSSPSGRRPSAAQRRPPHVMGALATTSSSSPGTRCTGASSTPADHRRHRDRRRPGSAPSTWGGASLLGSRHHRPPRRGMARSMVARETPACSPSARGIGSLEISGMANGITGRWWPGTRRSAPSGSKGASRSTAAMPSPTGNGEHLIVGASGNGLLVPAAARSRSRRPRGKARQQRHPESATSGGGGSGSASAATAPAGVRLGHVVRARRCWGRRGDHRVESGDTALFALLGSLIYRQRSCRLAAPGYARASTVVIAAAVRDRRRRTLSGVGGGNGTVQSSVTTTAHRPERWQPAGLRWQGQRCRASPRWKWGNPHPAGGGRAGVLDFNLGATVAQRPTDFSRGPSGVSAAATCWIWRINAPM